MQRPVVDVTAAIEGQHVGRFAWNLLGWTFLCMLIDGFDFPNRPHPYRILGLDLEAKRLRRLAGARAALDKALALQARPWMEHHSFAGEVVCKARRLIRRQRKSLP